MELDDPWSPVLCTDLDGHVSIQCMQAYVAHWHVNYLQMRVRLICQLRVIEKHRVCEQRKMSTTVVPLVFSTSDWLAGKVECQ